MTLQENRELPVIGSTELISVGDIKDIPAKIDTGADTSSIWASNISMEEDGTLSFSLFNSESPFFTQKTYKTHDYRAKIIRSSHGDEQIRYRVKLPVTLGGITFETSFTLANRARNVFPVLIGRHTIKGRFLVDVSKSSIPHHPNHKTPTLNQELQANPIEFHQKYILGKEQ